jgi:mRNA-degrading endonuclease RelE of RelBE toxin-antitoxin system
MTYLSDTMPKSDKTKRAEVHLLPEVFEQLKKLADKENRSLKNYMETVLIDHVKEQKKKKH